MSDLQKMIRIYVGDVGIIVNSALVLFGVAVAVQTLSWWTPLLIAAGWACYLLEEHTVHRYIFHAPPPRRQWLFNILYRLHYGHHDQVYNRDLLFTPAWFSVGLGLLNVAAASLLLPVELAVVLIFAGSVPAYLFFEWLHLLTHFNASRRSDFAVRLTRAHARHHFADYTNWFTVSPGGGLVDKLMGTDPEKKVRRENATTCGLDPNDPRLLNARARFGEDRTLANRPHQGTTATVPAE